MAKLPKDLSDDPRDVELRPAMFDLENGAFICTAGRWRGWLFRLGHDGQFVSVRKLKEIAHPNVKPSLLDAAKALMAMIDPDGESTDIWCVDMRAAIEKASTGA